MTMPCLNEIAYAAVDEKGEVFRDHAVVGMSSNEWLIKNLVSGKTGLRCVRVRLVEEPAGETCHAQRDGDCTWNWCPQNEEGEPEKSGRHCPLDKGDRDE